MPGQPDHKGKLDQQDQGQSPAEIPVLRLMMEYVHPQGGPQAAPQEGKEERVASGTRQRPFRARLLSVPMAMKATRLQRISQAQITFSIIFLVKLRRF